MSAHCVVIDLNMTVVGEVQVRLGNAQCTKWYNLRTSLRAILREALHESPQLRNLNLSSQTVAIAGFSRYDGMTKIELVEG